MLTMLSEAWTGAAVEVRRLAAGAVANVAVTLRLFSLSLTL